MACSLSHTQYEELRRFEDGLAHYIFRAPPSSLTAQGYLARVPNSGETKQSSAWRITPKGHAALAIYRERFGIKVAAMREP